MKQIAGSPQRLQLLAALLLYFFISSPLNVSAENTPIKIGATLALSGKLASIGVAQQQGLELAVEDINRDGGINGRRLELVVDDNTGDQKIALSGVNKLLDSDSVDLLFSSFSHITQAIKARVQRASKVMIYAASLGDIAKESPLFFRDWGDAESQGATLARAVAAAGHKNVAFLTETSEGCLVIQKSFLETAAAKNITVVAEESYDPGETDFKPILLRVAKKKPAAIATCTWRDGFLIMPQLRTLGLIHIPTFQYLAPFLPASDSAEIRKLYEENGTRVVWLGFVEAALSKTQSSFFERLKIKYGSAPKVEAALAYDDIMILASALKKCPATGAVDAKCVATNMQSTEHVGAAGPLRFDSHRRSNRPDLLIRIKDGIWISAE